MSIVRGVRRKIPVFSGLFVLICLLAACGGFSGTNTGGSTPPTPTASQGPVTTSGCPSNAVVTTLPSQANVTVKGLSMDTAAIAHTGDVIEIRLPFGHRWTGPTSSQGVLELQPPAGFAWKADSVCIWRFIARAAGSVDMTFHSQALCPPGQLCPMYITTFPITIDVK